MDDSLLVDLIKQFIVNAMQNLPISFLKIQQIDTP